MLTIEEFKKAIIKYRGKAVLYNKDDDSFLVVEKNYIDFLKEGINQNDELSADDLKMIELFRSLAKNDQSQSYIPFPSLSKEFENDIREQFVLELKDVKIKEAFLKLMAHKQKGFYQKFKALLATYHLETKYHKLYDGIISEMIEKWAEYYNLIKLDFDKNLYRDILLSCKEIYKLAPWKYFDDTNLFGIKEGNITIYFYILGANGDVPGLIMGIDDIGLEGLMRMRIEGFPPTLEYSIQDNIYSLFFNKKEELEFSTLELLSEFNLSFHPKGYPEFFVSRKGLFHEKFTKVDLETVAIGLDHFITLFRNVDAKEIAANVDFVNNMVVAYIDDDMLKVSEQAIPDIAFQEEQDTIFPQALNLLKYPLKKTFEVCVNVLDYPVLDIETERLVWIYYLIILDKNDGNIKYYNVYNFIDGDVFDMIKKDVVAFFEELKLRPKKLLCDNVFTNVLLSRLSEFDVEIEEASMSEDMLKQIEAVDAMVNEAEEEQEEPIN